MTFKSRYFFTIGMMTIFAGLHAQAADVTGMVTGPPGLNTVPTARMLPKGTMTGGVSTLDPYMHGFLGFQFAEPLYIGLRQTAEVSNINHGADRLYPGLDLKLRLSEETDRRPDIALGLQSAIGHTRMAGEYLAFSKRWNDFDFSAGIGWGRFGSAGHFENPLNIFGAHFSDDRALDGEDPNGPDNWFTGDKIGLFGGVEYFTPLEGLSLKFDYGADRYEAERAAFGFDAPAAWSVGAVYRPVPWADLSLGAQGTDKIMARFSMNGLFSGWRDENQSLKTSSYARPESYGFYNKTLNNHTASGELPLAEHVPAPFQIGQAASYMNQNISKDIQEFAITPTSMGLRGRTVRLPRSDVERAALNQASASEIWRNTEFTSSGSPASLFRPGPPFGWHNFNFTLDNQISLAEDDTGLLYRTSFITGFKGPRLLKFLDNGLALRLNLADNLDHINRLSASLPVRSDARDFADNIAGLERAWIGTTLSFKSDLHLSLIGGYLEEMYAGAGGEILYRPFGPRFALGAEAWQAFKRDPDSALNYKLNGDHVLSGHFNAWYDLPWQELTLHARAGRYLAEDWGGTLALQKQFDNGVKLEGFITVTDRSDRDLFGDNRAAYNGIRLSLPLGGYPHMPRSSAVNMRFEPFGRDAGQSLDKPVSLYEETEKFSYTHMARYWDQITP